MAKARNTFALGLTVLVMFALFFGVLMFIGVSEPWGEPTRPVTIRFAHTLTLPPLETGSPVLFGGQRVGVITSTDRLEKHDYLDEKIGKTREITFLYVETEIQKRVDLRVDCVILPEGPILGGPGLLVIQNEGHRDQRLGLDDVVEGRGMGGFAAVTEQISQIGGSLAGELDAKDPDSLLALIKLQLDASEAESMMAKLLKTMTDLNAISTSIREQLDPEQEKVLLAKLHLTLDHINAITGELKNQMDPKARSTLLGKLQVALDTVNASLATVDSTLGENQPVIRETLANVRQTSETLKTGVAKTIAGELDAADPKSLMAKIHASVERLGTSLDDLNTITGATAELVTLNKDNLNKILANFKETSDHMKAATKDLRRNPWRLLYRPSLVETKELNIFDAARSFAEAATRLDDATARLESLLKSRDGKVAADDPQLKEIRAELQDTFKKFNQAETALWTTLNIKP